MLLTVIVLMLLSAFLLISDVKRNPPDRVITEKEAEKLDIYIFSSRLSGFGSLYVADENGKLFDYRDFL